MTIETVYQVVSYDVISINDPELEDALNLWTDGSEENVISMIPADTMTRMQEDKSFLILDKTSGSVGVITPMSLSLNFEEYHPSEGFNDIRKTTMELILEEAAKFEDLEESDDFFRGMDKVLEVIRGVQVSLSEEKEE